MFREVFALGKESPYSVVTFDRTDSAGQAIEEEGEIRVRTFPENGRLCIQISDTGVGISADQLERIFDFGFRATDIRARMKFGLPTVYGIVQEHKGEIKIESEVGKGTEVTITLPVEASSPE